MKSPETELNNQEWFKENSLRLIRQNTSRAEYPGYPEQRLTASMGAVISDESIYLPDGEWYVSPTHQGISEDLSDSDNLAIKESGLKTDQYGRPIHPWINELIVDEIGVFTGKGFYWKWGQNKTVDPVVIRNDLDKPHVLLVVRSDTKDLALPGGFHDPGETYAEGAAREAEEEALRPLEVSLGGLAARLVYSGPMADSRATANAWPHTDAFRFDLPNEVAENIPLEWRGGEEVDKAIFAPIDEVDELIFGSHSLLIKLATR